ncbi:hypothetical protein V6N13_059387 [Hibiscus sabdariffa]
MVEVTCDGSVISVQVQELETSNAGESSLWVCGGGSGVANEDVGLVYREVCWEMRFWGTEAMAELQNPMGTLVEEESGKF